MEKDERERCLALFDEFTKAFTKVMQDSKTLDEVRRVLIVNFGKDGRATKYTGGPVLTEGLPTVGILLNICERMMKQIDSAKGT